MVWDYPVTNYFYRYLMIDNVYMQVVLSLSLFLIVLIIYSST